MGRTLVLRSGGEQQEETSTGVADHDQEQRQLAAHRAIWWQQCGCLLVSADDAENVAPDNGAGLHSSDPRRMVEDRRIDTHLGRSEGVPAPTQWVGEVD